MDTTDLTRRIQRVSAAVGATYDANIEAHIRQKTELLKDNEFVHTVSFGGTPDIELENHVTNIVHGIASLKDHIKLRLQSKGADPQLYEQLIDHTPALALIDDLDNIDKHTNARYDRSGKEPRIEDVRQALQALPGQNKTSFSMSFDGVQSKLAEVEGDFRITISASIVDRDGEFVMGFDEMVAKALDAVEGFIRTKEL